MGTTRSLNRSLNMRVDLLLCVAAAFMAMAYSAFIEKKDVGIAETARALDVLDSQLERHGFLQDFNESSLSSSLDRKKKKKKGSKESKEKKGKEKKSKEKESKESSSTSSSEESMLEITITLTTTTTSTTTTTTTTTSTTTITTTMTRAFVIV